jgi:starch phosphorylase
MAISEYYLLPSLPEGLEGLTELALDLRWSWNHAADTLWKQADSDLWNMTGNPWLILQTMSGKRLQALSKDAGFRKLVDASLSEHRQAMEATTWFEQAYSKEPFTIAYFSREYAGGGLPENSQ